MWVAIIGMGPAHGAQGDYEHFVPLAVLGGDFVGAEIGVEVDGVEQVRRRHGVGLGGEGFSVVIDGLIEAAELSVGVG